tara:strand:- start:177 stop:293 length:117 start_codon:yes stop_codon:yes gene_type:complete
MTILMYIYKSQITNDRSSKMSGWEILIVAAIIYAVVNN